MKNIPGIQLTEDHQQLLTTIADHLHEESINEASCIIESIAKEFGKQYTEKLHQFVETLSVLDQLNHTTNTNR